MKPRSGFSLIELLVSITLITLCSSVILYLYSASIQMQRKTRKHVIDLLSFQNYILTGHSHMNTDNSPDFRKQPGTQTAYGSFSKYIFKDISIDVLDKKNHA